LENVHGPSLLSCALHCSAFIHHLDSQNNDNINNISNNNSDNTFFYPPSGQSQSLHTQQSQELSQPTFKYNNTPWANRVLF
tara:strand:- start:677 stop:919 length:243 start_codon:yes stop_codon:yes gene_type:complete